MRGKRIICMQLVLLLITSIAMVNMAFSTTPTFSVSPQYPVYNPGDTFTLDILIENAPEVSAWEFKIKYNIDVLAFPIPDIEEGGFLSRAGQIPGNYPVVLLKKNWQMLSSVQIGCSFTAPIDYPYEPAPEGDGTLCTLTMEVTESGISELTIYDVILVDFHNRTHIPCNTVDGYFHTTKPFVDFTWEPANPEKNELVTFNSSACWDPDGGTIDNYIWDFGDGTPIVETTSTITTHTFTAYRDAAYGVTLTAVDDEMDEWSKTKPLRLYHDITVPDLWNDASAYLDMVSYVQRRDFDLTLVLVTCVNTGTYTESFDVTLTVTHDETGTAGFILPLWGNPVTLAPGTGSGFGVMALWLGPVMGFDLPAGRYTMTATATPHPGEIEMGDTADNTRSISILLVDAELRHADIKKEGWSISKHGDIVEFKAVVQNKAPLSEEEAEINVKAFFEIVTPEGDVFTLVTGDDFITNWELSTELTATWGPITVDDVGLYAATAWAEYGVLTFGEMEYYAVTPGTAQDTEAFSFRIEE